MWADAETEVDFLNYSEVAELVRRLLFGVACIAPGASSLALGRPLLYGSAFGDVQGVYEQLKNELI